MLDTQPVEAEVVAQVAAPGIPYSPLTATRDLSDELTAMTSFPATPGQPSSADLLAQVTALQNRFASPAVIEQAKGALMVTDGFTANAAFDLSRFHSQNRNANLWSIPAIGTQIDVTHREIQRTVSSRSGRVDAHSRGSGGSRNHNKKGVLR